MAALAKGKRRPRNGISFGFYTARGASRTWQCFSVLIRWGFSRVGGKSELATRDDEGGNGGGGEEMVAAARWWRWRSAGGGGGGGGGSGGKNWTAALTRS